TLWAGQPLDPLSTTLSETLRKVGPVLGVGLGVLAEDVAVDTVELDEATDAGRRVSAVEEDAPRRPRAKTPPRQLAGGVADGEAEGAGGGDERVGLVDAERPRGEGVVRGDRDETERRAEEAEVPADHVAEAAERGDADEPRGGDEAAPRAGEQVRP